MSSKTACDNNFHETVKRNAPCPSCELETKLLARDDTPLTDLTMAEAKKYARLLEGVMKHHQTEYDTAFANREEAAKQSRHQKLRAKAEKARSLVRQKVLNEQANITEVRERVNIGRLTDEMVEAGLRTIKLRTRLRECERFIEAAEDNEWRLWKRNLLREASREQRERQVRIDARRQALRDEDKEVAELASNSAPTVC